MRLTNRKTHFTERIPLLSIRSIRTDRHMAYTDRYGAGVLDNPHQLDVRLSPLFSYYYNYLFNLLFKLNLHHTKRVTKLDETNIKIAEVTFMLEFAQLLTIKGKDSKR